MIDSTEQFLELFPTHKFLGGASKEAFLEQLCKDYLAYRKRTR